MRDQLPLAAQTIQEEEKFLVLTHVNPDGDALGSSWATTLALRQLGKNVYLHHPVNPGHRSLEGCWQPSPPKDAKERVAIILDTNNIERMAYDNNIKDCLKTIVIDHHATNEEFGDVNLVDAKAMACAQVLPSLFDLLEVDITEEIAKSLYVGLITDIDQFSQMTITPEAKAILTRLEKISPKLRDVKEQLHSYPDSWQQYAGLAQQRAYFAAQGAYVSILTQKDLVTTRIDEVDIQEATAVALKRLFGVPAEFYILIYQRYDGRYFASLRSSIDQLDVGRIAVDFGGGGHNRSAGFQLVKSPQETLKALCVTYRQLHLGGSSLGLSL